MPDWWSHNLQAWLDLVDFFTLEQIVNKYQWQSISSGESNHNYLFVQTENEHLSKFFVQIINQENTNLLPISDYESISEELINHHQINPWLAKCYVQTPSIRIYEWADVEQLSHDLFDQPLFLKNITEFLFQLHSHKLQTQDFSNLTVIDIQHHLDKYTQLAFVRSPQASKEIEQCFKLAKQIATTFTASCFCHNDLSLSNLLWNNHHSRLTVVDWEYACYSDPLMDLAGLIINSHLNSSQERTLLALYCDKMGHSINITQLLKMKNLNQLVSTLWHFASHSNNNPDSITKVK